MGARRCRNRRDSPHQRSRFHRGRADGAAVRASQRFTRVVRVIRCVDIRLPEDRAARAGRELLAPRVAVFEMDPMVVRSHGMVPQAASLSDSCAWTNRHLASYCVFPYRTDSGTSAENVVSVLDVKESVNGARFSVHVQPRASRTEVAGVHGAALKVRLHSPPVDGAANEELVSFLARELGVSRRAVRIVAGQSSRAKIVEVDGVSAVSIVALTRGNGS